MKFYLMIFSTIFLTIITLGIVAPNSYKIERVILIQKPIDQVFSHLKILKNHDQWSAWAKKDPLMKKEFSGTDGTLGFMASWISENKEVGTGEQEITNIIEGEKLETKIRLKKPFEVSFNNYFIAEKISETETKVKMGITDQIPFPANILSFIVNNFLGQKRKLEQDMDASLKDLKILLEK